LPDESDRDHLAFVAWCTSARRGAPYDVAVAERNQWSPRAAEYDAARKGKDPDTWSQIAERLQRVVAREVRKLERASNVSEIGVPIPPDLTRAFLALRGISDPVPDAAIDVAGLSTEELRAIEAADRALARVGGKR
jgi:hypothetical protein